MRYCIIPHKTSQCHSQAQDITSSLTCENVAVYCSCRQTWHYSFVSCHIKCLGMRLPRDSSTSKPSIHVLLSIYALYSLPSASEMYVFSECFGHWGTTLLIFGPEGFPLGEEMTILGDTPHLTHSWD